MGADGHIKIWRADEVKRVWPDAASLFSCMPTAYIHILDGVEYYHVYWGDNLSCAPFDFEDCYSNDVEPMRLKAFLKWMDECGTEWEVWT